MNAQTENTLRRLAGQHRLDANALLSFAREDDWPGWMGGSDYLGCIWQGEGRVLYALARLLRPALVYDLGTNRGVSAMHLAAALQRNGTGRVISIDIEAALPDGTLVGSAIPDVLRPWVTLIHDDAQHQRLDSCGLVCEDADHTAGLVEALARQVRRALLPGGFCVHHDADHCHLGPQVVAGLRAAGVDFTVYQADAYTNADTHTGIAVWRQPLEAQP